MFTCVLRRCVAFHSLVSTQTFRRTLNVGGQLHGDKECTFIGVTSSGRVWRKVPESEAWSVALMLSWPRFILTVYDHVPGTKHAFLSHSPVISL